LVALLASIGDVPVRQCLAVTGSVDQFGNVQAVGGVNEKVEGFFDLCAARGLDGSHGVVVPASTVSQLMLRDDIVQAVADGRFALHAVCTVDDAVRLLTGMAPGDAAAPGDDTVNGRIAKRLREYTLLRRGEPRFARRKSTRGVRVVVHREGT
jgi:predicted ATP-dependent protease